MPKKYPITGKASLEVFGHTCHTMEEVGMACMDKELECMMGRIHHIVREVGEDGVLKVAGLGIELWGADIAALKAGPGSVRDLQFISAGRTADAIIKEHGGEPMKYSDIEHACFVLEKKYVTPKARLCREDPYLYIEEDAVAAEPGSGAPLTPDRMHLSEEDSPEETMAVHLAVSPLMDCFSDGMFPKAAEVMSAVLDAAVMIAAISEDPEGLLQQMREKVGEKRFKLKYAGTGMTADNNTHLS